MPGILFAGRRWNLSSDDLLIPALMESSLRFIWLITLSITYFRETRIFKPQCTFQGRLLLTHLIGLQLLQIGILTINAAITHLSMQGTILWEKPREGVTKLICLRVILFLPEIAWHLAGAVWSGMLGFNPVPVSCSAHPFFGIVQTMVYLGMALTILILMGIYIVFDPAGSTKNCPLNEDIDDEFGRLFIKPTEKGRRKVHQHWLRRIQLCFCCVSWDTGSRDAFQDVSVLFSEWFNDVDVVPTDLLCALILLKKKQNRLRKATGHTAEGQKYDVTSYFAHPPPITREPTLLPRMDWMTPQNALHFMRFAWGSYGWPGFMLSHLCTGVCTIWEGLRCLACWRAPLGIYIRGDNCCECHTATVRTLANVSPQEILMFSFKNSVYKIPFFVCFDHSTNSVLLVVRGTLSANDILTDLTAGSTQITIGGVPPNSRCHKGIFKCAAYILAQLTEHRILEEAFKMQPTYRLVLTGHSLGAGVAATLALLLRSRFPELICYSFSPPGGTFSRDLCRYTESFVFSLIVGDDLVSRLGLGQLDELKKQMLVCLMEADQPKYEIVMGGLNSFLFNSRSRKDSPEMTSATTAKYEAKRKHIMEKIVEKLDNLSRKRRKNFSSYSTNLLQRSPKALSGVSLSTVVNLGVSSVSKDLLHPPGRILHLTEADEGFKMWWTPPEFFDHVIISAHMFTDHLPDMMYKALKTVVDHSSQGV